MYIPRHWHFAISTLISLLGFYIKHKLGDTYDVVIVFFALQYHAVMHTVYIVKAGLLYQAYVTQTPAKDEPIYNHNTGKPVEPMPAADGFIPLARKAVQTVPVVNQQVVSAPRFDKERNFAVTLIRMHEYDPEKDADMTETKWVKSGKFVRADFKAMLEVWEGYGVIARKSKAKNAPYRVNSWAAVRLIANGNPLPPLPR